MTKRTTISVATLALFLSSPAWAQQQQPKIDPPAPPQASEPSQPTPSATPETAQRPSQSGTAMFVDRQKPDERLATELKGLGVKNTADETLGSVSDIVLSPDGKVSAILVGVGGFLGIGTSDVAVAYDAVELATNKDGAKIARINASREIFEMAPRYVTIKAQADAEKARQQPTKPATPPGRPGQNQ